MLRNMVKESAAAPGTGTTVTLSGAQPGYAGFAAQFGNGAIAYYAITDGAQTEFQVGTVTVGSPNTLSRGAPLWTSTGATTRLNFTGAVTVYCALPSDRSPYIDKDGVLPMAGRRIANLGAPASQSDAAQLRQVGWEDLSRQVLPGTVSAVHTTLPAGYDRYRIEFSELRCAGSGFFWARFSFDGTNFVSTNDYNYVVEQAAGTAGAVTPLGTAQINLTGTAAAGVHCFGWIEFGVWGNHNWLSNTHFVSTAAQHAACRTAGRLDNIPDARPVTVAIANSGGVLQAGGRLKLLGSAS